MKKINGSLILVVISFLLVWSLAFVASNSFLDKVAWDNSVKQLTLNQKPFGSNDVVIVAIDDKSIEKLGWPWPRTMYTDIFDYLQNYSKAKAIIFDGVILLPDSYNPAADKTFNSELPKYDKLVSGFNLYSTNNNSGDILPQKYDKLFAEKNGVKITDSRNYKVKTSYSGICKFPKEYIKAVPQLGAAMVPMDKDGVIRRYMPVVEYKGELYPSLALSAYALKTGVKDFVLTDNFLCSSDSCKSLKIPISQKMADDSINTSLSGVFFYYNWYKPKNDFYSHDFFSAYDVLKSREDIIKGGKPSLSPDLFKDKVVIVGANAEAQSLEDRAHTPVLKNHSALDIQATAVDNMLENGFFVEKNTILTFGLALLFTVFAFFVIRKFSIIASSALLISSFALYVIVYNITTINNLELPLSTPIVSAFIVMAFQYSYKFIKEGQNKEKIKNVMGKYISKDIMQNVMENIDKVSLGGIKSEVTILFADIRGFTAISENMSAEEVTGILNEYFSAIEPIIRKYDGVLNKFMGDAVLAIFGEPVKNRQHAMNAVKCANEILKRVKELQNKWLMEGKPKIAIGIGINTGEAFVGNIGSEERFEYTVIGDTVNLASRIEAHNRIYKTKFLISENTYKHINNIADVIKISDVSIRGKAKKIDIYEVLRITE